ncbi:hypothetical protein A8709_25995 [Paenibacillus pectinilyticus]|uniref:Uncharacterized protein n=1 Tax=Paenibacillus pectinilyticus TaxID=512399 RepID=A0A1C1A187_9BACL|nr:hypothetical protein [Paenibacillus pectinilyticus]OCT14283.1 hypothetical protein A8709_25995 [Paenibacillus pectinilyticus]
MFRKLHQCQEGGIVLEASLILPLFLAFVVGLVLCIQIAIVEMAMQAGVTEATKSIAGQLYPVQLIVQEAKSKYDQSRAAEIFNGVIDKVQTAKSHVTGAEEFADAYEAYIPDSLVELIRWEKEKRELGEGLAQEELNDLYESQVKPRLLAAFTPVVFAFCDASIIGKNNFKVSSVTLPSMEQGGQAFFGVEAQLTYKLPIPFMSQTIIVKKRAYERAWVGA